MGFVRLVALRCLLWIRRALLCRDYGCTAYCIYIYIIYQTVKCTSIQCRQLQHYCPTIQTISGQTLITNAQSYISKIGQMSLHKGYLWKNNAGHIYIIIEFLFLYLNILTLVFHTEFQTPLCDVTTGKLTFNYISIVQMQYHTP